jgi:hypothetical protein
MLQAARLIAALRAVVADARAQRAHFGAVGGSPQQEIGRHAADLGAVLHEPARGLLPAEAVALEAIHDAGLLLRTLSGVRHAGMMRRAELSLR